MPPKNSKKRQVSEPKKPVKPHGKPGGIQRTPLHAYDKAANQDLYNVQDIIAERQEKGVPKYLVRWEGFEPEDDTWEPIEHLAGAEDYIARFVEERNAAAKRSEEEHAAKRAKRRECAEQQSSQPADNDVPGGSRSKSGEPETIKRTTNMATHLRTRHSKYVLEHEMKSQTNTLKVDTDKNTLLMGNMAKWTPERRHLLCRKIAYWLVKRNRPLTLVEHDTELRDVFLELSGGRFDGCSHHEIQKHLLQMDFSISAISHGRDAEDPSDQQMHQQTVQMFDVTNWGGEGYKEHKLDYDDWQAIQQTVAVLDPSAKMTNLIQGTKYPTLPLVLPMITHVIHHAAKPYLSKPWDKRDTFDDFTPNVQFARAAFIADLRDRWVDNLSPDVRRLVISTLLDPRFKSFDFLLHGGRVCALRLLRAEWRIWKGVGSVAIPPIISTSKVPVDCLSAFFSDNEAEAEATDSTDTEKYMAEDELEAYLVCPDEAKETDILMWWKTKSTWPKLQLMARQYLAVPATSAGVERLFSKASLAHGDLAKAMKEETLSFALFASYNYAPSMYEGFQM
ncbi:hypothetical protein EMCRGX_G019277 [Ephydatia muelleri]